MDAAGIDANGVIIIHGGGTYGDKEATMRRWIEQFDDLPLPVKRRLVLENCEKSYCPNDCLEIAGECGIPVVYDCHHYQCYYQSKPLVDIVPPSEFIGDVIESWDRRRFNTEGTRVLCHVSSQGQGKVGHHADYIDRIPRHLLNIFLRHGRGFDLEVEAKAKEQAIFRLWRDYPQIDKK
jgi:UV DNA damage endonuclease